MSMRILSNFFLLTIISSLLTSPAVAQIQGKEICAEFDPYFDRTAIIVSTDGAAQTITQTGCVQYFQVNLPLFDATSRYLIFELNIQNSPRSDDFWPILLEKVGAVPELYFAGDNTVQDKADTVDFLAYTNRKSYHNIVVENSQGLANSSILFAMYQSFGNVVDFKPETFTYTVTAKLSNLYPCPRDCSGNGDCSQIRKQCLCNQGFFDSDCSVAASFLDIEKSVSQVVEPDSWKYYYLNAKNYGGDVKLTVDKGQGSVYMAFLFNKFQEYKIPNLVIDQGQYNCGPYIGKQSLTLLQNELRSYDGGVLMIGTYNSGDESILVDLELDLSDGNGTVRTALMFTMIGISIALLAIWAIFTIAKYKVYIQAQAMQRAHIRLANQKVHLSKEDIEKYFPKMGFENMKSSFSQTTCSICLEDFKGETVCRQLYCEHIYHDACIELWLSNKDSCPNCKKEITVTAIEEFLAGPKPNSEDQAATVEEGRPLNDYNANSQPGSIVLDGADSRQGGNENTNELKVESIERIEAQEERPEVVIELENLKNTPEI